MSSTHSSKIIVWAVDAFEELGRAQFKAAQAVRCLQAASHASVYPVHILSPAELNLSAEFPGPWISEYRPAAEKALARFLNEAGIAGVHKPTVLLQSSASTARAADLLIRYAQDVGAELIVVGTHGRSGVRRLLLGSFSETLLMRSKVPVMVAGPRMQRACKLETVLVPTEFGEGAKAMFRRVVALAGEVGAKITLFHAIPRPVEPVFQSGVYLMGTPWVPVHEHYSRELARNERRAASWARWAANQGVSTEVVIGKETDNIAESIVQFAEERKMGWIAMAAHHGPIASVLLGSVTRQVVRNSDCPVWTLRRQRPVSSAAKPAKAA